MAQFTPEQVEYTTTTIALAISQQSDQIGSFLAQSKDTQDNLVAMIEKHNTELHASSDRVTKLVGEANRANLEFKGSTDKINDSESLTAKVLADLQTFEANQISVFAAQKS